MDNNALNKSLEEHPVNVLQGQDTNGGPSSTFSEDRLTQVQKKTLEKAIRLLYKIHGKLEAHAPDECNEEFCLCGEIEDDFEEVIRLLEK